MKLPFKYRRVPYAEIRAFSVHILTASGSFMAFLALVAAAEERFVDLWWWLGVAMLIDGRAPSAQSSSATHAAVR